MTNDTIRKRRSIRKYQPGAPGEEILAFVRSRLETLVPLDPGIRYGIELVRRTKGLFGIAAPQYLVFTSEEKAGGCENIGFLGQQMDLFFQENGLGACWLGMARPEMKTDGALPFVVSMAFGAPAEPLHRELSDFKRKTLEEISEGSDPRIEAARLAPSGMNAQGWFFSAFGGAIRCYRKKPGLVPERLGRIDMGIALWHIASESAAFRFFREPDAPARRGYIYAGTVGG